MPECALYILPVAWRATFVGFDQYLARTFIFSLNMFSSYDQNIQTYGTMIKQKLCETSFHKRWKASCLERFSLSKTFIRIISLSFPQILVGICGIFAISTTFDPLMFILHFRHKMYMSETLEVLQKNPS